MSTDPIAQRAMQAFQAEDPNETRKQLQELIEEAPDRIDLRQSLSVVLLQMGEAQAAAAVLDDALEQTAHSSDPEVLPLVSQLHLTRGAAYEELYQPRQAELAYQNVLNKEPENPYALQRLAFLYLSWGRLSEGTSALEAYLDAGSDQPEALEANQQVLSALSEFENSDLHPKNFLEAHHGSYVEFFDHHAERMEAQGWFAEAAHKKIDPDTGAQTSIIPEGARSYAAVRVDLVDPASNQVGRVGDQPMIVALANYEALAQTPVLMSWPGQPFAVYVSSRCPWNNLAVHIRTLDGSWEDLDATIGDWYEAGFNGSFGTLQGQRFHEISVPQVIDERSVVYYVDCGRAGNQCIDDLLQRLEILHSGIGIDSVVFGQGFLP